MCKTRAAFTGGAFDAGEWPARRCLVIAGSPAYGWASDLGLLLAASLRLVGAGGNVWLEAVVFQMLQRALDGLDLPLKFFKSQ